MIYNPLDKTYKSIIGAISEEHTLTICVKGEFDYVALLIRKDGEANAKKFVLERDGEFFRTLISLKVGLYFYFFDLGNGKYIGRGQDYLGEISSSPVEYQLSVYKKDFHTPDWIKGGLIYQIFPDRFCRAQAYKEIEDRKVLRSDWGGVPNYLPDRRGEILNNDFFGGDIQGIISKLDYLADLGVTAIYLNPIFKAYSNHRYDTGDYMAIDPLLGDLNDFLALIQKANNRGIKIILDGVFNHTGSDSVYFNKDSSYDSIGAFQSKDSKYSSWFKFIDFPNDYESWWGIKTLPATDKNCDEFINYICAPNGVLDFYTRLGLGGWRLDVVDELPSHFVKKIRSIIKETSQDSFLIGEVWENASNKISYGVRREYFLGQELDSVMNYPLKNAIINFVKYGDDLALNNVIIEQIDNYPEEVLHSLMNILSTHDTFRLLSAVGDVNVNGKSKSEMANITFSAKQLNDAVTRLKCASLLQFTLCGVPCVYYGDEVGMQGYSDPLNRGCFPWGNENEEILSWYKKISKIRKDYSAFTRGRFEKIYSEKGVFLFKRCDEISEVLVAVNLSKSSLVLEFDGVLFDLISETEHKNCINLESNTAAVYINN